MPENTCREAVWSRTDDGMTPCGRPAVTEALDVEESTIYPVCGRHAPRRGLEPAAQRAVARVEGDHTYPGAFLHAAAVSA